MLSRKHMFQTVVLENIKLKFTVEFESQNKLNSLDQLIIMKTQICSCFKSLSTQALRALRDFKPFIRKKCNPRLQNIEWIG